MKTDTPQPLDIRDGVLYCETCGLPMTPTGDMTATLLGYMPKPGHDHDDNCIRQGYVCDNHHYKAVSIRRRCPNPRCNWIGQRTCFCHTGLKVDEWPKPPPGK